MSLRKSIGAVPAVIAALAVAAPAASASTATVSPSARTANIGFVGPLQPGSIGCLFLVNRIRFAVLTGNTAFANILSNAFLYTGCGGAAI